jgi:hypothetical protein
VGRCNGAAWRHAPVSAALKRQHPVGVQLRILVECPPCAGIETCEARSLACERAENRSLARIVTSKLRLQWSPEQIAGWWLKHTYPGDESCHVSHETIYRSLFIQARGALKKELL